MIEEIIRSQTAEICLIIKNEGQVASAAPARPLPLRIWNNRKKLLYILYGKFDRKKFNPSPDAFEPRLLTELVQTDSITVSPIRKKFSDTFREADVAHIKNFRLDLIIRLGFRILRGGILQAAEPGRPPGLLGGDGTMARNRGAPADPLRRPGQWIRAGRLCLHHL
jgi:hypothetical protein